MDSLKRFIDIQETGYDAALREIKAGRKRSHWIWYIFPQISGLGYSPNALYYGINGFDEAVAYLSHPVLGGRLREITRAVLDHSDRDIVSIMGSNIDAVKFRSSMTLFDAVSPGDIFSQALATFFDGKRDELTLKLLAQ